MSTHAQVRLAGPHLTIVATSFPFPFPFPLPFPSGEF